VWKHRRNYLSTCHHLQVRLTLCIVAIPTKPRRKYNEQPWQLRRNFVAIATKIFDKSKTYDADVVCATKNRGNLRRIPMEIATTLIHQDQSYDEDVVCATKNLWQLATKVRRYCHGGQNAIFFRRTIVDIATMALSFKKKKKLHEIWYYHITL
jgi:hypothetical protein